MVHDGKRFEVVRVRHEGAQLVKEVHVGHLEYPEPRFIKSTDFGRELRKLYSLMADGIVADMEVAATFIGTESPLTDEELEYAIAEKFAKAKVAIEQFMKDKNGTKRRSRPLGHFRFVLVLN